MAPLAARPGGGMFLKTRWGKVSEKLSRYWGDDSEKRQAEGRNIAIELYRAIPPLRCSWLAGGGRAPDLGARAAPRGEMAVRPPSPPSARGS
jgi:hypothetical protein